MRRPLVAGNWKMNGSLASARELLQALKAAMPGGAADMAVFPPFVHLAEAQRLLHMTSIAWGAQNVAIQSAGAFTGEIAASMLVDLQCRYVLVGHSERRTWFGETDDVVAQKYRSARKAGLIPILCVGETLQEREAGLTEAVVSRQIDAVLKHEDGQPLDASVIAYEPVWAIGTGKTATPDQAQQMHAFIRGKIAEFDATIANSLRILYGGSVKANNAAALFIMPDIDGGLVGGASLDAVEFLGIFQSALR